jgi:hypothetical protein
VKQKKLKNGSNRFFLDILIFHDVFVTGHFGGIDNDLKLIVVGFFKKTVADIILSIRFRIQ